MLTEQTSGGKGMYDMYRLSKVPTDTYSNSSRLLAHCHIHIQSGVVAIVGGDYTI